MAILTAQRDFSSGELNIDAKRRDDQPIMRAGARQLRNWRVLNSGAAMNRAGRRAIFGGSGRVEKVLVAPGLTFYLGFGLGFLSIFDATGNLVTGNSGAYSWTNATVRQIVLAIVPRGAGQIDVVMTFPGQIPKVATWTSGTGWSFSDFSFTIAEDGSVLLPFYRLSASGITIQPSASVGIITLTASAPVFFPGMVGTIIRWNTRQVRILTYIDSTHVTANVIQQLLGALTLTATGSFNGGFAIGDIIGGANSGTTAEIFGITGTITSLQVNVLEARLFSPGEGVFGPNGSFVLAAQTGITNGPTLQWDDAVFSTYRGWPQSCFFDQNRLGFCDIPALPNGIGWSRIAQYGDFLPAAVTADDPIFEIAPERSRVYHVATKQDEIVLTDRGVWYIPINETNPLKPGSVVFKKISVDAASQAAPSETNEGIVFIGAGQNRVVAIVPTGTLTNPWQTKETSLFHQHLFNAPYCIVSTIGDDTFAERYVYVLNTDGTVAVGKYDAGKEWVGWLPWDGKGVPQWISVLGSETTFVTQYGGVSLVAERLDSTIYLDGAILLNAPPVGLLPPGGGLTGPLWWLLGGSVDLMDGIMPKGTYQVDGVGNIIPNNPGEDLSSPTLLAGQSWVSTLEPFPTNSDAGADQHQRMRRRRILRIAATVEQSTGFKFSKLYAGIKGALLPVFGSEIGSHRVPTWNQDDNQALPPPTRNQTYLWRPTGRFFDPRAALVKDVPGPITVVEIAMEIST